MALLHREASARCTQVFRRKGKGKGKGGCSYLNLAEALQQSAYFGGKGTGGRNSG